MLPLERSARVRRKNWPAYLAAWRDGVPACCKAGLTGLAEQGASRSRRPHGLSGFSRITRHETRLFSKHGVFGTEALLSFFPAPACLASGQDVGTHPDRLALGAALAGAAIVPLAGSTAFKVFTKHETRNTKHGFFSKHGFFQARNTVFPWLVWCSLVLKPFSLVFSAGMCSGLRVMTPLLGTKTSSTPVGNAPAGDNKAAQVTPFQVFTRSETRDTALAGREAQAGANSEVFSKHETRDTKHGFFQTRNTAFPWLLWCSLVLKPFSLFFGRRPV